MLENNQNLKILPKDVLGVFKSSLGSNHKYTVSRQKEQLRAANRVDSVNEYCSKLSEEQKQKLIAFCERWGGRMPIHIYRMLGNGRSLAEKTFALNFIENFDELWAEILKTFQELIDQSSEDEPVDLLKEKLQTVLGGENYDSTMFWTFAPYVYKNLKDPAAKARLKKIFDWAILKGISPEEIRSGRVHLKGMDKVYRDLDGRLYYLTINSNDLTHKFTDQEAHRLVEEGVFN